MATLRVAYILNTTIKGNGATKAFMPLLKSLMAMGVHPLVVTPDKDGIYHDLKQMGVDTVQLMYRPNSYTYHRTFQEKCLFIPRMIARLVVNSRSARQLAKILKDRHIQIVHTNSSVLGIGCEAAKICRLPHVFHFREYADKDFGFKYFPSKKRFYESIRRNGDYGICITKDICRYHGFAGDSRFEVIYDGICHYSESMPQGEKDNYFLYAGRIQHTKGLDILLEAYHQARQKIGDGCMPRLKVAGMVLEKDFADEVRQFVANHDMNSCVEFLGNRDDIKELMQRSKALIVPSRFEGFGLCMPEAMSVGCLCIGFDNAGTKEQFDNGEKLMNADIGLRFRTIEELEKMLIRVAQADKNDFDDIRSRAFRCVNELYSFENDAKNVYEFYMKMLKE